MLREMKSHLKPVTSIGPSAKTANANGTGVDHQGFDSQLYVFQVGTITDGTHTPKIMESDDNISFTDVAAEDLVGSLSALASNVNQSVAYIGNKRYSKAFVTVTGSPATGGVYGALCVQGHAHAKPVA